MTLTNQSDAPTDDGAVRCRLNGLLSREHPPAAPTHPSRHSPHTPFDETGTNPTPLVPMKVRRPLPLSRRRSVASAQVEAVEVLVQLGAHIGVGMHC